MDFTDEILDDEEEALSSPSFQETSQVIRVDLTGPLLAVDIGTVYTRAVLLNVVEGEYRFVGRGIAPSTARAPWNDIMIGVVEAIEQITAATGHTLVDKDGRLIMPERTPFYGVSGFAATSSAGEPVKALLVGLMPSVSVNTGRRIAARSYLKIVDIFSLADRRSQEQQIDALIQSKPDLILVVGGTDGGAKGSLLKILDTVALACSLMEYPQRPAMLFAGNSELHPEIKHLFEEDVDLRLLLADNVRPTLETEKMDSVQREMAKLYNLEKALNTGGFEDISSWTKGGVVPSVQAFSKTVNVFATVYDEDVLGIDLASSGTTIAATINGEHYLSVFENVGTGYAADGILDLVRPQALARWLSYDPESMDSVMDAVHNRWLYPHTIPATMQDIELEFAIAREVMRILVNKARESWLNVAQSSLPPSFDTVIMSGAALTSPPHYGWTALAAADALLPIEPVRLLADPFGMSSALGALTSLSRAAVVQSLDTGAFFDLGTMYSVTGRGRIGDAAVRVTLKPTGSSEEAVYEVPFGGIGRLPLEVGREAEISFQTQRVNVSTGRRGRKTKVVGGELGVVIDARGRPWRFPRTQSERREWLKGWIETMTEEPHA